MYVKDGIAYAGELESLLKIVGVRPLDDFWLWVRFSNHEERLFDMKPLFKYPVFRPLEDPALFARVYIDYGTPTWSDGEIDLAPETLYDKSIPFPHTARTAS
jgi:hypothetical protein